MKRVRPIPEAARAPFEEGRRALELGDPAAARVELEEAFRLATDHPDVMSWFGVTCALAGADRLRGVALCEEAIRRAGPTARAEHYHHLGRAYLAVGYKPQAVQAFRRGGSLDPDHAGLQAELVRLGVRRNPIFPFLRRSNPLNKYLGLLRHRLFPPPKEA